MRARSATTPRPCGPSLSSSTGSASSAGLDKPNEVVGYALPRQLRHPLDRGERGDRHDAREDRLVYPERRHLISQPFVFLRLEEELRDREVGQGHLRREIPPIRREVG